MCQSSTSTKFTVSSTRSLDVDDAFTLSFESSHNVATSSNLIITVLNNLYLIPCKGLVNNSANILLVGQCLAFIFPYFTLSTTQKNLILMCLDLLEHELFPFLAFFYAASLSCHRIFYFIEYPCASRNLSYQIFYGRYSLLPITSNSFEIFKSIFCLPDLAIKTAIQKLITPPVCPLMSMHTV